MSHPDPRYDPTDYEEVKLVVNKKFNERETPKPEVHLQHELPTNDDEDYWMERADEDAKRELENAMRAWENRDR